MARRTSAHTRTRIATKPCSFLTPSRLPLAALRTVTHASDVPSQYALPATPVARPSAARFPGAIGNQTRVLEIHRQRTAWGRSRLRLVSLHVSVPAKRAPVTAGGDVPRYPEKFL